MSRPCPSPFPHFIWGLFWGTAQSPALEGAQERPCLSPCGRSSVCFFLPPRGSLAQEVRAKSGVPGSRATRKASAGSNPRCSRRGTECGEQALGSASLCPPDSLLQAGGQLLCPWALGRWPLASPGGGEGGSAQLAWVAAPWGPHSSMPPAAPSLRGAASSLQNQPTR